MARIPSGVTDQGDYFVAVDSTDLTTRETGLSSFTVYRSRNNGTPAAMTTPTITECDATNMPGVYFLLMDEDTTIDAGDDEQSMAFHITHAGMAPVTFTIELYRPKISAGETFGVSSGVASSVSVSELQASALADLFNTDSGTTYGAAASGSVVSEIADNAGGSALTLDDIADAVWDEAQAGHVGAGTFGEIATEIAELGSASDLGSGATIGAMLADMAGATFSNSTDSLEALRDHIGDGTNLTEAGGDGDHLTEAGGDGDHLTEAGGDGDHLTEAGGDGDHLTEAGGTGDQLTEITGQTAGLTFTVAGKVDVNVTHVNEVEVGGAGTEGDPFGPA